jgi:HAD superfamily hydrolase (TIGR01459 family)
MTHDTKPAAGRAGAQAPLLVASFGELAPRIDVLICDVWGVVHNGARAHVQACAALERFRAGGGKVVLVSNAPRPADSVVRQMVGYGVPETVFDGIVTSGDLTRQLISERPGQRVLHLGPERDISLFAAFGTTFADADGADYCVCTGLLDDETETAADYAPRLARIAGRGLEMICANPDLVVERGDRLLPCAGALAQVYEGLGGRVIYAGKPHLPVYARALQIAAELTGRALDMRRVMAVGDALRTDIAGARAAAVPGILLLDGIHWADAGGADWRSRYEAWLAPQQHQPDFVMERLTWP